MKPFIQITRHLYEEPHHLNLVIIASNGHAMGSLEFYLNSTDLEDMGEKLTRFPKHEISNYLYEIGSERPEDNFGHFFKLLAFKRSIPPNECFLQFRFNNNKKHPDKNAWRHEPQISEFCLTMTVESLNRLGQSISDFSKLERQRLYWTAEDSILDNKLIGLNDAHGDVIANAFASLPK